LDWRKAGRSFKISRGKKRVSEFHSGKNGKRATITTYPKEREAIREGSFRSAA